MKTVIGLLLTIFIISIPANAQYLIKSPYLQNPDKAIDYVDSCAKFWLNTYDDTRDGFYTNIDKYGNVTASNKNMLTQTRNAYGFVRAYMLTGDLEKCLWLCKSLYVNRGPGIFNNGPKGTGFHVSTRLGQ